ncbi:hypothetical protein G7L40_00415 [Paenibacillus polymyxa]|uniref:Uncharacterized protein n=1 Tax=Paenibacillus polymyxa TaxID=1406 RepID=A0A378XX21_PAEPO|nr:hypothetical protein [Paenibacillus polymyxa]MBE7897173.1 hypothetical protein [Paenibacillus polymyxa]MCC3257578.1 hypothetical protein [Paenibacillus polymyxa]QPK51339.1 hypothetical protein G7035_00415 [Paenibacillus polymyxa]QPK56429.1 hypothetical protein G7L40_00415 [Paenibacillus polymyxa]SUA68410.1 Uncharacterised protein [Paenibacillus polymyxa]
MTIKQCGIEEVIKVVTNKGAGTDNDPIREVVQYWNKSGNLIVEIDSIK